MTPSRATHILDGKAVRSIIERVGFRTFLLDLIEHVERAFVSYQRHKTKYQARNQDSGYIVEKSVRSTIEVMHAMNRGACFKIVNYHPENRKEGLPTVMGLGVFVEKETGFPEIVADMTLLTALRTAAASAVAAKYLSSPQVSTLGLIGAGVQAEAHALALSLVKEHLERLFIFDTVPEAAAELAGRLEERIGLPSTIVKSAKGVVAESSIIATCTFANKEVVKADWLNGDKRDVLIIAVGADTSGKHELEPSVLGNADAVVVDMIMQATSEGETAYAVGDRTIRDLDVKLFRELGEIVKSKPLQKSIEKIFNPANGSNGSLIVFDSTGTSFEDLAVFELLMKHTQDEGKQVKLLEISKARSFPAGWS